MENIFQTKEWAEFKVKTGYEKYYEIDGIFVLQKRLPFGRTMLYAPMVGEQQLARISNNELRITDEFTDRIKQIAKSNRSIFYRMEFDCDIHNSRFILHNSFRKSFEEMQPEHTLVLDISKSEAEILAQMKQKGRYNIKVAEKNDVKVIEDNNIDNFFKLYSIMANRQKITFRSKRYYEELFDNLHSKGYVKVLTAYVGKQDLGLRTKDLGNLLGPKTQDLKPSGLIPIASAIISFYKDQAIYLFGGSSDEYRNLMAPYLVQWTAIREAKKRGCTEYDFFGIAPDDNSNHPWAGVTRFKKQFGGEEKAILGSYDQVFKPVEYKLFKIAERIRR